MSNLDICWEAYLKNQETVSMLLSQGENIEFLDRDKRTPFLNATTGDDINFEFVKFLVEKGANINAQDSAGYTALHFCVQENNLEIILYLLQNGAEVDLKDKWGNTPLMRALNSCYAAMADGEDNPGAIITTLLKAGANPESINNHGVKIIDSAKDCDRDLIQFFN